MVFSLQQSFGRCVDNQRATKDVLHIG